MPWYTAAYVVMVCSVAIPLIWYEYMGAKPEEEA
jgi:hypothetical protein